MTKFKGRRKKQRFEAAGTLVLGRTRAERSSASPHWLRNVLLLLLAVAAAGAVWLMCDDRFYVYHVEVAGTARLSPDDVLRASGLPGLHILWVRPAEVEAEILATLPALDEARVVCRLPAECAVTVVERQPKVMWDDDGQLWWIDAGGVVFPAYGVPSDARVVRGPLPRDGAGRLDEPVRVALTELWAMGVDVSPLLYVPERGLVLTDERGWRVFVGEGPGMAERLQVLEWLAPDLEARGLRPRFVDVRFPDAPYYSLTNDW